MIILVYLLIFFCLLLQSRASSKNLNDPIVIAIIACGTKAKYHLPSYLASLLNQPTQTRARLKLYLFGDVDVWTTFHNTGCVKTLKSHFFDLIYKNLSDYSSKWGGNLSILTKLWKFDNRYGCASFKLDLLNMIPDTIHRLIYMDLDTIVFEDLANLHDYFHQNPTKIMFVAMESYRENFGFYANSKWNSSGKSHFYQPSKR